jgi:Leucine-rich repeat (LRR) protein
VVLSRLGGLQSLELTGCHLDDASLTALAPLSNISTLKLDNNPGISDAAIPTILAQFPRLKEFSFKGTSISQDGISRLKKEKPKLELE